MKSSGILKFIYGALLTCFLLCTAGCETIPGGAVRKPISGASADTYRSEKLCTLLTKEEVGAALKMKMAEPKLSSRGSVAREGEMEVIASSKHYM